MSAMAGARELPASAQLMQMIGGKWLSRAISAAAEFGIADRLNDGPKSTAELAGTCGAHEPSLYRLLRALASVGIFEETARRQFGMTPLAEPLRSDAPDSLRNMARFIAIPMATCAWDGLEDCVRTGQTGMARLGVESAFGYLEQHPDEAAIFNAAMTDLSRQSAPAIAEAYDFSRFRKLVDVGGGYGMLLSTVLRRYPRVEGVLFDLPHVIESARSAGLPERCETASGSFFEAVPAGADGYMMKHIVHDWDDERATLLLRNCRRAIDAAGRLLVIEAVIAPGNEPSFAKLLDLEMLVMPGGRERTEDEYRELFAAAGFELTGVFPTKSGQNVIEGRPV
jgi:hypothetical protein